MRETFARSEAFPNRVWERGAGRKGFWLFAARRRRVPRRGEGTTSSSTRGRETLVPWKGLELVGLSYQHPFLDRTGQVFSADFVTAEAGTGLVHIAPGHGQDDYQLGQEHGLPILAPVDDRGCLTAGFITDETDPAILALVGQYVFKANAPIIEISEGAGGAVGAGGVQARLSALLAVEDADCFSGGEAVVYQGG